MPASETVQADLAPAWQSSVTMIAPRCQRAFFQLYRVRVGHLPSGDQPTTLPLQRSGACRFGVPSNFDPLSEQKQLSGGALAYICSTV